MDVSVIIVNYNTTGLTRQAIVSVLAETRLNSFEILVVDNNSPDRSIEVLADEFSNVNFILSKYNEGFGRANNIAIDQAKGKYLFLLNSDAYLVEDSIARFYKFMEDSGNADVACCGGELLGEDRKPTTSFGNLPSMAESISRLGLAIFYKRFYSRKLASGVINYSPSIKEVGYITGADMFIRKKALDVVGNFDPDFFLYFEETELSFRFKKNNYKSVLLPDTKIIHLEGGSQKVNQSFNFKQIEIFAKSRWLYFRKCHGVPSAIIIKFIFSLQALLFSILKLDFSYLRIAYINIKS